MKKCCNVRSNQMNRRRIWESWEKFSSSVRDIAEAEWVYRKNELLRTFGHIPKKVCDYPLKTVMISTIPAICFMTFFNFFSFWKRVLGEPREPYLHLPSIEYAIFGCLPHQVLSRYTHPILDILAAIPYLAHFLLPFGYPAYCYYHRNKFGRTIEPAMRALWLGGTCALISVIFQYLFPTSPPWFNDSAVYDKKGQYLSFAYNEAGFQRIDALIGLPLFHEIYSNAPITHGSFPSLHAAFPVVIFLNGSWVAHGGWKFGILHCFWIAWAAMYSHHHYLIDIIAGVTLSIVLFQIYHKIWNPFIKPPQDLTTLEKV